MEVLEYYLPQLGEEEEIFIW